MFRETFMAQLIYNIMPEDIWYPELSMKDITDMCNICFLVQISMALIYHNGTQAMLQIWFLCSVKHEIFQKVSAIGTVKILSYLSYTTRLSS